MTKVNWHTGEPGEAGSYLITTQKGAVCTAHWYPPHHGFSGSWSNKRTPLAWAPFPDAYTESFPELDNQNFEEPSSYVKLVGRDEPVDEAAAGALVAKIGDDIGREFRIEQYVEYYRSIRNWLISLGGKIQ